MFNRLRTWANERHIYNNDYDTRKHAGFISEELTELLKAQTMSDEIDAYFDICIFAMNAIEDAGYNLEKVFDEGFKEIESRKGTIVNGKFEKFKDEESKAKWYKANCRSARY